MAMASETKLNISLAIEVRIEVSDMAAQKKSPFSVAGKVVIL